MMHMEFMKDITFKNCLVYYENIVLCSLIKSVFRYVVYAYISDTLEEEINEHKHNTNYIMHLYAWEDMTVIINDAVLHVGEKLAGVECADIQWGVE